jgi:NAD(P)-dependent dehydrogenase (short-subunit alcohol dehydrogenase family)
MQVNVNAPWLLSCACLPLLRNAERGRLFFLLDDLEVVTDAYWGAYGTAKAALSGMVRQFAASLSNTGLVVHAVNPGPMRTAFRAKVYHAENPLEQPEPEIAAAKILSMLTVDKPNPELIVDLTA